MTAARKGAARLQSPPSSTAGKITSFFARRRPGEKPERSSFQSAKRKVYPLTMRLSYLAIVGGLAVVLASAPLACSSGSARPAPGGDIEGGVDPRREGGLGGEGGGDAAAAGVPADIAHFSTLCGTTACGIMGIKKSGFQELADVSFVVKDSVGKPVGGIAVKFELESPPSGTEFLGDSGDGGTAGVSSVTIKTDPMGKATARVQSGVTLGVFVVTATVLGTSPPLQAKSPAIGVRGVTPANRGFNLQCQSKNLAAYIDPQPPHNLKTSCTVTLIDRFNNPVGKPTTINLKVEAGAIPSSVQSTAFSPMGANTDEGKATVDFSTIGTFPPVNVLPQAGEPTGPAGNQRDALVTVLAYVAGEEAFDDNNSNGQWDVGENFIDQGEPFVDSNDNNVWDAGEFYADVAPSNGKYDPPNKVWDKQTTIWTTTYILYSGVMSQVEFNPAGNVTAPVGSSQIVTASFADARLNPPPAAPTTVFSFSRAGARGTITTKIESMLDGYGFELTRALFDGDNPTVGCSAGIARCEWLTKFTFPSDPYTLGITATILGAAAAGSPEPNDPLTFTATVNGTKVDHVLSAYFP